MLKKLSLAIVAVVVAVPMLRAASAEDLTGRWSGKFVITVGGESHDDVAFAVLKHKGAEFGGTIGPTADEQWPISNAKVTEAKDKWSVTFQVSHPQGGMVKVDLSLINGHLVGTANMTGDGGETMTAKMDLERVK